MGFINDFLRAQEPNANANYALMGNIGMGVMVLAVLFYIIRMRPKFLNILKVLAIAMITYCFMISAHGPLLWYQKLIVADPNNFIQAANLAVAFTLLSVVAWLCAKTFNTSTGFAGDVVALTALGYHITGRSGCIFGGCCYGFPCQWGWYSTVTKANQFPTAFVESLFTVAILVFIIVRICRKNYVPDGRNLPYFLLLYGVCRFFSEMTRESTEELWLFWRISDIHIHMLLMAIVGGLMLWHVVKKERAAAVGEDTSLPTLSGQRK